MEEREDKRIRRTKKLLRQALTRLMQQKDFQSITVTDVVREADINRGTFYAHYRDVYDLREKIESEMIADFRGMIYDIHLNGGGSLHPVLMRAVDYLEENREIVTTLVRVSGAEGFSKKLIHVIEECRMESVPCRGVEDVYVARFIATGVVGMLERWVAESQPLPKNELIALMEHILSPMLQSARG